MNTRAGGISLLLWLLASVAHAGTKHYYYTDAQGTVLAKADAQGNIVATYDYAPYGAQVLGAPPSGPTGYTAHVNDAESGLVYMQARYYDPVVGRFLSVDPVTVVNNDDMRHFNRYLYAYSNPYKYTDYDGRCPVCVVAAAVVGRVAVGAAIGATVEIGVQVAWDGKRSWAEIDKSDVAVSAGIGAVLPGMGSVVLRAKGAAPLISKSVRAASVISKQSRNTLARAQKLDGREVAHLAKAIQGVGDVASTAGWAGTGVLLKRVGQEAADNSEGQRPVASPPPPKEDEQEQRNRHE